MQQFVNDYMEGAAPEVLDALVRTNMEKTVGYGLDPYCESAREKIRAACKAPEAEIHFLVGGTQTNETVLSSLLRPYEGVIAVPSAHIAVHEAGTTSTLWPPCSMPFARPATNASSSYS